MAPSAEVITNVLQILPTARIILCGSPAEGSLAQDILALVPAARERVLIATDELPIGRLLALQERAHSLISVNTGPAHSAAAMGCPEVVMFTRHAHRAADLYAPQPTTAPRQIVLPTDPSAEAGLDSVTPDAVVNAWQELAGIQTKPPSPYPYNWVGPYRRLSPMWKSATTSQWPGGGSELARDSA